MPQKIILSLLEAADRHLAYKKSKNKKNMLLTHQRVLARTKMTCQGQQRRFSVLSAS